MNTKDGIWQACMHLKAKEYSGTLQVMSLQSCVYFANGWHNVNSGVSDLQYYEFDLYTWINTVCSLPVEGVAPFGAMIFASTLAQMQYTISGYS